MFVTKIVNTIISGISKEFPIKPKGLFCYRCHQIQCVLYDWLGYIKNCSATFSNYVNQIYRFTVCNNEYFRSRLGATLAIINRLSWNTTTLRHLFGLQLSHDWWLKWDTITANFDHFKKCYKSQINIGRQSLFKYVDRFNLWAIDKSIKFLLLLLPLLKN